jgi:hypothetical protein
MVAMTRIFLAAVIFAAAAAPVLLAAPGDASICIAPIDKKWPPTAATGDLACPSNDFSLRIDESFTFRFSDRPHTRLSLFLNDLYKTAQLWDSVQNPSPWCRCK